VSAQGRLLYVGAGLVALVAAFWFLVLAPKRAEVAKVDGQIAQAQSRRAAAVAEAATAGQARAAYQRDYGNLARLGKAAPADDDVASLVVQLESLAKANKIDFRSVKLTATTGAPAEAPAPAASGKDATGTDTTAKDTSGEKAAKDNAPATPAPPAVVQAPPGAVVGSAGLLTVPFTFEFDGGYLPMQRMLGAIDRLADATGGTISVNGRLLTVDGFSLSASRLGFPKIKALVSATAYIVPPAEGITAGATAQGPTAGAVPAGAQSGGAAQPPANATAKTGGVG
jgi:hypothetical protein